MKKIGRFVKKRWYLILIILIVGGYIVFQQKTAIAKKEKEQLYTVKRMNLEDSLSLSGNVNADEHVVLRFQTSGRLSWVGVKEGDNVIKYQGIASLDQRDVKKKMEKTLNEYAKERNDFDQSKDDNQRVGDQPTKEAGNEMKRLLEKAQYDLTNSVLDVELQDLAREYSYLYTPIAGIVIRVDSKYPGVNITPTTAEFEILNPDTLYFSFTADQTEIIKLKEGTKGEIEFDAYPEEKMKGVIYYISYTPKEGETGTVYEGRIRISENKQNKYRFGMTGDIDFILERKENVIGIPSSYIRSDSKGTYVYKYMNGKQIKTYIKVGKEIDDVYEILSGIQKGDSINISNLK